MRGLGCFAAKTLLMLAARGVRDEFLTVLDQIIFRNYAIVKHNGVNILAHNESINHYEKTLRIYWICP